MVKTKGKILSAPIAIVAMVLLIAVGAYLVFYIRQINQTASPTTSGTPSVTNQTTPENSDSSDTSDTSDETADWLTYTNDQYGFSFKYPSNWEYKVNNSDQWNSNTDKSVHGVGIELRETGKSYSVENSDIYAIGIFVENSSTSKTPLEILNTNRSQPAPGETVDINSIMVGGLDAAQLENYIQKTTVVVKNKIEYHISTPEFGSDTEDQPIRDVYDQILSTFEFTD